VVGVACAGVSAGNVAVAVAVGVRHSGAFAQSGLSQSMMSGGVAGVSAGVADSLVAGVAVVVGVRHSGAFAQSGLSQSMTSGGGSGVNVGVTVGVAVSVAVIAFVGIGVDAPLVVAWDMTGRNRTGAAHGTCPGHWLALGMTVRGDGVDVVMTVILVAATSISLPRTPTHAENNMTPATTKHDGMSLVYVANAGEWNWVGFGAETSELTLDMFSAWFATSANGAPFPTCHHMFLSIVPVIVLVTVPLFLVLEPRRH
jgi:hypothetical protein